MAKNNMLRMGIMLALMLIPAMVYSQQGVERAVCASGGGYAKADNITLEYTVGQVIIGNVSVAPLLLTQGFQQTGSPWANNEGGNSSSGGGTGEGTGTGEDGDGGTGTPNAVATVVDNSASFALYPNPATTHVRVALGAEVSGPVRVALYSVAGQQVLVRTYSGGRAEYELLLHSLPAGMYVVQVLAQGQTFKTVKLIKH